MADDGSGPIVQLRPKKLRSTVQASRYDSVIGIDQKWLTRQVQPQNRKLQYHYGGKLMGFTRRLVVGTGLSGALYARAMAQSGPQASTAPAPNGAAALPNAPPQFIAPDMTIPLWPGQPPGGPRRPPASGAAAAAPPGPGRGGPAGMPVPVTGVDMPTLGLYRPAKPDGSAVIICPGGGYFMLSTGGEGSAPAKRFNEDNVTAFMLTYRLPAEGWSAPDKVPLQDVQRAVRLVRSRASEFKVDPDRVGVMGFSAGGHLAASAATFHAEATYEEVDSADRISARPAFAALIYAVIALEGEHAYTAANSLLFGSNPTPEKIRTRSVEQHVTSDTSPCFLAHGMNDGAVPVENSMLMVQALRARKVACEAHLFERGQHGFGLGTPGDNTADWPSLFVRWMRQITNLTGATA